MRDKQRYVGEFKPCYFNAVPYHSMYFFRHSTQFKADDALAWRGPTDEFSNCCERLDAPQIFARAGKAIAAQV